MQKYLLIAGVIIALVFVLIFLNRKKTGEEKLEIKLIQNAAIQNVMMNPNSKTIDDLLPQELQMDPWETKYKCRVKSESYIIWSAGPDKSFGNLFHGEDDMLIFESGTLSMNQKEDEIINMFKLEGSTVLAEVLLNSKNKKLEETARKWAEINGYIVYKKSPLDWFRELKEN